MADVKDLLLVFLAGLFVGWIAREVTGQSASVKQYSNLEKWEMWEDEEGRLHAEVHRKVTPK